MAERGSKTSGWVGIGCGCLVVVVLVVLAAGLYVKKNVETFIREEVAAFVAEKPVELPEVIVDSAVIDAVNDRFDAFRRAVAGGQGAPARLELDSGELNILITHHPLFTDIADKVRVELEGDVVTAQLSFPLGSLPLGGLLPLVGGGFVNGSAQFSLSAENGIANLLLGKLEVNGKALPEAIMAELQSKNLLEDSQDIFGVIRSIAVKNGKLIVIGGEPAG